MRQYLMMIVCALAWAQAAQAAEPACPDWLNQDMRVLHAQTDKNLCAYAGKPLLIVNTASYCGYTPQFQGLEALYKQYRERGLVVIGFPSGDFWQESGDEAKTAKVCYANYGVTFDMYAPIAVTGKRAHPLYKELARRGDGAPGWNFFKYLVNGRGEVVGTFSSKVAPDSEVLRTAIEKVLKEPVAAQ